MGRGGIGCVLTGGSDGVELAWAGANESLFLADGDDGRFERILVAGGFVIFAGQVAVGIGLRFVKQRVEARVRITVHLDLRAINFGSIGSLVIHLM